MHRVCAWTVVVVEMGLCLTLAEQEGGPASNLSMDFYYDCRPSGWWTGQRSVACDLCPPHRYSYPRVVVARPLMVVKVVLYCCGSDGVVWSMEKRRTKRTRCRHVKILINILIYAIERPPLLFPPCRLHFAKSWERTGQDMAGRDVMLSGGPLYACNMPIVVVWLD